MAIEKYRKWKDENGNMFIPVSLDGPDLLHDSILNKGTAFSTEERREFRLVGLLPSHVSTLEEQVDRLYEGYCNIQSPIEKYAFLRALQDRKEILFYALVSQHVEEMIPIIYTPTVGDACRQFSHRFQTTRGLYITPDNVDEMNEMIHHFPSRDIRIIVATDSQGILGIGDQGVGGMGIPIGKLSLYVLGAGIHPASCLPIVLDVGTNNEKRLEDPLYLGIKRRRMVGAEYDQFIEKFVNNVKSCFPDAVLQWEDFSKENAFGNLERYRDTLPSFNDDIQGTGAVTLAGILGAVQIKKEKLTDQNFAIYGAGAGGGGIAYQLAKVLTEQGLSNQEAFDRIFLFDSRGLLLNNRESMEDYKVPFSKPLSLISSWKTKEPGKVSLLELTENHKITVLVGVCGQGGVFGKDLVENMLKYTDQPIIFPLSNPTDKTEATPEDLFKFSNGQVITATGSPFDDVLFEGKSYRIGQGNNVFIFPGVGLSAVVGRFKTLPSDIFTIAATALAECVSEEDLAQKAVYPRTQDLHRISVHVARRILEKYIKDHPESNLKLEELEDAIHSVMWTPEYLPYRRV